MRSFATKAGIASAVPALILAGLCTVPAGAALTMTQTTKEITITSTAGSTWKVVFATNPSASSSSPGGGTARALYIPANSSTSLVDPQPAKYSALGLDNLEWRYINGGGIRSDIGRNARASAPEILEQTATRIVFRIQGSWRNISSFVRTTTVTPDGYSTKLEATWDGPTGFKSMWWLLSRMRSDRIDGDKVTIQDRDTKAIRLPYKKECICSVPSGIDLPYTVTFPLRSGPGAAISLTVSAFGDGTSAGKRYEFWPAANGYYFFFPRWVSKFQKRKYSFDWGWKLADGGGNTSLPPSTTITSVSAGGGDLIEGQSYTFTGEGQNLAWEYDAQSDGLGPVSFGSGQTATFTVPTGVTGAREITVILTGDGGTDQKIYRITGSAPDTDPPVLSIARLRFGGTVDDLSVAQIAVGGVQTPVSAGRFAGEALLGPGTTSATLTATDGTGNSATRTVSIVLQ